MTTSIFDPAALISSLPRLLPVPSKTLKSQHDGITALLHTAMVAVGFRLVAVDDSAPANDALVNVLPSEWNSHSPGHFALRYRHDQSSMEFIIKVVKLGSRTLINGIATEVDIENYVENICTDAVVQSDKAASLDISTNDFTSPSFYPCDLTSSTAPPLVHGFISSNRVTDLLSQIKTQIIQKLVPNLNKEGYQEERVETSAAGRSNAQRPRTPPDARPQPPPLLPDLRQQQIPPRNPLEIGRRDLDPIPRNPFSPPSLFPGNDPDGMFVGPDHPIFGARGGSSTRGPWGGDGYLPPMGAPPGARFDPVGPGLGPGIGPFPGRGNPLSGRGRRPPGGHGAPDNDEFMPPGAVSTFPPM